MTFVEPGHFSAFPANLGPGPIKVRFHHEPNENPPSEPDFSDASVMAAAAKEASRWKTLLERLAR